jgi:hypothetical protein
MKVPNECIVDMEDGFGHFVLSCITHLPPEQRDSLAKNSRESGHNEVVLTIDGVEVPVKEVVTEWMKRYEAFTTERALNLLKDRMDSINNIFHDAKEEIDGSLRTVKEKVADAFNFSYDSWDDRFLPK